MTFKDVLRYKNTDWPTDVFTSPGHVTVGEVLCLVACSCCDVCYHGNITQEQLHLCRRETSRVDGLWHWGNAINSLGGNSMHWGGGEVCCARHQMFDWRTFVDPYRPSCLTAITTHTPAQTVCRTKVSLSSFSSYKANDVSSPNWPLATFCISW